MILLKNLARHRRNFVFSFLKTAALKLDMPFDRIFELKASHLGTSVRRSLPRNPTENTTC